MDELLLKASFLIIAAVGIFMFMADFSKSKTKHSVNKKYVKF